MSGTHDISNSLAEFTKDQAVKISVLETEIKYLKEELTIQKLLTKSWFMEYEKLQKGFDTVVKIKDQYMFDLIECRERNQ